MALEKALEILPKLVCHEVKDSRDVKQVTEAMKAAIASKQYGQEDFLTTLITKACGKLWHHQVKERRKFFIIKPTCFSIHCAG